MHTSARVNNPRLVLCCFPGISRGKVCCTPGVTINKLLQVAIGCYINQGVRVPEEEEKIWMKENELVYEFQKNANERVRAEFCEYKGRDFLSLRVYFQADTPDEEWRPTQKGITLSQDQIPELKKAIDKVYEKWRERKKG